MQLSADSGLINRRQARQQEDGKKQENTVLINTKAKDAAPLGSLRYKVQSLFFIIYLCIKPNFRHVRLRHAKELLSVDPKKFVYSGAVSYSLFQIFTFCPKFHFFKTCKNMTEIHICVFILDQNPDLCDFLSILSNHEFHGFFLNFTISWIFFISGNFRIT